MKKLIFKKSGELTNFIEWLDRFSGEISHDSLVIEIDPTEQVFISKTYSDDKSLVRYSKISFIDANLEISKKEEDLHSRVLVGIFLILPKFIKAIKTFATADDFQMSIDYDMLMMGTSEKWCATSVTFKSKTLKMKIPGSSISAGEMNPLSDEVFLNKVWVAPDPISVTLSADLLKNLVSISDIFANADKMKNFMEFYTKNVDGTPMMFVRDPDENAYDYELGPIEGDLKNDVVIPIYRDKFLLSVKNAYDETKIIISTKTPNRVLIELKGGDTKTIIARVNR